MKGMIDRESLTENAQFSCFLCDSRSLSLSLSVCVCRVSFKIKRKKEIVKKAEFRNAYVRRTLAVGPN